MLIRKLFVIFLFLLIAFSPCLFSQIVLDGVVTDNGAEPVESALVEVIDQSDTACIFSDYTDAEGRYVIEIEGTGVDNPDTQNPGRFALFQNYPNPFNPSTVITYTLPRPGFARIEIWNILGQRIRTLLDGFHPALSGQMIWDGTDDQGHGAPAGIYIYSLKTDGFSMQKKMLLMDGGGHAVTTSTGYMERNSSAPDALNKPQSGSYRLRITGENIETYVHESLAVTGSTTLNVTVSRTVTDIDGNVYHTVRIGGQWWMAENLKVSHYRNGDPIPNVTDASEWSNLTTGACCYYDNNSSNGSVYGCLYNWYAVDDSRNIAPEGWHVPTDTEWQTLVDYLGGDSVAGGKLKEAGTVHWQWPNWADNESGFTALPGGGRFALEFAFLDGRAHFWSSTENGTYSAWYRYLDCDYSSIFRDYDNKKDGFSVRLIRGPSTPVISLPSSLDFGHITVGYWLDKSLTLENKGNATLDITAITLTGGQFSVLSDDTHFSIEAGASVHVTVRFTPGSPGIQTGVLQIASNSSVNPGEVILSGTGIDSILVTGTMTGNDGRIYRTVKIGDQWWMAENLKETLFRNGDAISKVTDYTAWAGLTTGACCAYNNNESNADKYGYLYNWYAVDDSRNIAPPGWHVPIEADWGLLVDYLGGSLAAGGKMKMADSSEWNLTGKGVTNESGFSALPGGIRQGNEGVFDYFGEWAVFGSSTEYGQNYACHWYLANENSGIWGSYFIKHNGYSVRLVCDEERFVPLIETPAEIRFGSAAIGSYQDQTLTIQNTGSASLQITNISFTDRQFSTSSGSTFFSIPAGSSRNIKIRFTPGSLGNQACILKIGNDSPENQKEVNLYAIGEANTQPEKYGTMTGNDGRIYRTIKIGDQWWMAENLKETLYQDSSAVMEGRLNWHIFSRSGMYCTYEDNAGNTNTYGYLYNGYVVTDRRGIAPQGWHVPTDDEWQTLIDYLGGDSVAGGRMKTAGTEYWHDPNTDASNESGFSALPGGEWDGHRQGFFEGLGFQAYFWSSTQSEYDNASCISMNRSSAEVWRSTSEKASAFSIRLIQGYSTPVLSVPSNLDFGSVRVGSWDDRILILKNTGNASLDISSITFTNPQFALLSRDTDFSIETGLSEELIVRFTPDSSGIQTGVLQIISNPLVNPREVILNGTGIDTILVTGTMTGNDGRLYRTVKIGNQWWMAENLKETQYRNGDGIPIMTDNSIWNGSSAGAYCAYDNDESNAEIYGYLYNWYAVNDSRNIAPPGWHVPTEKEWPTLTDYLGGSILAGGKMKEAGTAHWRSTNTGADNSSGFTALPGGGSYFDGFSYLGYMANFWSSSEVDDGYASYYSLHYNDSGLSLTYQDKKGTCSIRLVRD